MAAGTDTPKAGAWSRRRTILALIPVAAFAALAGLFAFSLKDSDPSKIPSALIGKPVPEFTLAPVEGLTADSGALPGFATGDLKQGKVTVVNVWASWCAPCRIEHPFLMELSQRDDIVLVGVNYKDEPENARRFLGIHGNPFAAVGTDRNGRTAVDFGVYGVPETFIIDGKGIIRYKHVGPLSREALDTSFLTAIADASR